MNSYKLELFIHVGAVIVGLGATFALPFLAAFAERSGVSATRFSLRFSERLENFLIIPAAIVLFIFGGLLMSNDATGYTDDMPAWLIISIVWFLAAFAGAIFLQRRQVKAAIATLEGVPDTAELPDAYTAVAKRIQMVGGVLGLSVIGIAFLMIWKP